MIIYAILIALGINVLQAIAFVIWNLYQKSKKLQDIIEKQQATIQSVSDIIEYSSVKLAEIDAAGSFRSDDEVGFFFQGLQEIQQNLNNFIV